MFLFHAHFLFNLAVNYYLFGRQSMYTVSDALDFEKTRAWIEPIGILRPNLEIFFVFLSYFGRRNSSSINHAQMFK